MIDRDDLLAVMKRYQQTQPEGVKQVNAQLELFSADCVFISFPVASVVGHVQPRMLCGHEALRDAFVAYNQFIEAQDAVDITYIDAYADTRADGRGGICGFTLLINVVNGEKRSMAMNQAQFHVAADGLVCRMMNWQANSTLPIQNAVMV